LFSGRYVIATVNNVFIIGKEIVITARLDDSSGKLKLWISKNSVSMSIGLDNSEFAYRTVYKSKNKVCILMQIETKKAAWSRRKKISELSKKEGPKTIQLFTHSDNPSSRMELNKEDPEFKHQVRMRKAFVNSKLLQHRIDEINIGDTIAGYLFEDKYFEGIVEKRSKSDFGSVILKLKMTTKEDFGEKVFFFSGSEGVRFRFTDLNNREYTIHSHETISYHMITENDPSKRPVI
jgi:hypothetical protein